MGALCFLHSFAVNLKPLSKIKSIQKKKRQVVSFPRFTQGQVHGK